MRVREATGMSYDEIPLLQEWPPFGGHIFAKRGSTYIVGVGYPENKEGVETWSQFGRIEL
jgi:hypothetical protein